jgi:hypothetical protein
MEDMNPEKKMTDDGQGKGWITLWGGRFSVCCRGSKRGRELIIGWMWEKMWGATRNVGLVTHVTATAIYCIHSHVSLRWINSTGAPTRLTGPCRLAKHNNYLSTQKMHLTYVNVNVSGRLQQGFDYVRCNYTATEGYR